MEQVKLFIQKERAHIIQTCQLDLFEKRSN
jgi:hypothetical protein